MARRDKHSIDMTKQKSRRSLDYLINSRVSVSIGEYKIIQTESCRVTRTYMLISRVVAAFFVLTINVLVKS